MSRGVGAITGAASGTATGSGPERKVLAANRSVSASAAGVQEVANACGSLPALASGTQGAWRPASGLYTRKAKFIWEDRVFTRIISGTACPHGVFVTGNHLDEITL